MHLAAEAFLKMAGIKMNHIPAQGSGPVVTALLGGHVDIAGSGLSPALPHIKAGTLRALAVFKEKRNPSLPDVPTFKEMGYPVVVPTKVGFLAPKGTPPEVIEIYHSALKKVAENYQAFLADRVDKIGAIIDFMGPAEHQAFLKSQSIFFSDLFKELKP
jgi:tripartite-type tricarboxylate transporter receptor subunit TctC